MWFKANKCAHPRRSSEVNLQFDRKTEAKLRRQQATHRANQRPHATHINNREERLPGFPGSFRKGLKHGPDGFLINDRNYQSYRQAVLTGLPDLMQLVPTPNITPRRKWESPTAGFVFDLEGPDAQAITMPPAPTLGSDELAAELAEVYAMAALRDVAFANFDTNATVQNWITRLNQFSWFGTAYLRRPNQSYEVDQVFGKEAGRRLGRDRESVTVQNLFRGVTTGDTDGPFISQFLLLGNPSRGANAGGAISTQEWPETAGKIAYGAHTIDQRVRVATQTDFMTTFEDWLVVQNGTNVSLDYEFEYNPTTYTAQGPGDPNEPNGPAYRFLLTPRDLATYVHFDQLYQAYLNACLLMLERGVPVDPGIARFNNGPNQQGFAQFGGPHILSLVTEVATRALKAVRFQKFNIHNRVVL